MHTASCSKNGKGGKNVVEEKRFLHTYIHIIQKKHIYNIHKYTNLCIIVFMTITDEEYLRIPW